VIRTLRLTHPLGFPSMPRASRFAPFSSLRRRRPLSRPRAVPRDDSGRQSNQIVTKCCLESARSERI